MFLTARRADPAIPPDLAVSTDSALKWLRVGPADSDMVTELIKSAMDWAEGECDQPVFLGDYIVNVNSFWGRSPVLPGLNVSVIKDVDFLYNQTDTQLQPTDYTLDNNVITFPAGTISSYSSASGVAITYTAGYSTATLPAAIKQAIRLVIGDWYDNRADSKRAAPSAAEILLRPYKRYTV